MFSLIKSAIVALISGATADGLSTDHAIKLGMIEADPIMVRIFQTDKPSTKTIFLRGGIVIALESLVTILVGHHHPVVGHALSVGLLAQASYHIYAAVQNYKSIV